MEIDKLYEHYLRNPSVTTDTRNIKKGDIYFALKGPHFDGNAFAASALEQGASLTIIDNDDYLMNDQTIVVTDVLTTLQQLASYHRHQLSIPFIAITGSNGKTTTKELVKSVLASTYRTYATEGNLNNHIGIPLTLLRIHSDTEIAVIEMGANHRQEIAGYCTIVKPTIGLITNIGKAHLEGFGGIEGVKKGKGELFDYLRAHGGITFACHDFPYFEEMTHGINDVYWYGTARDLYISGEVKSHDPYLVFNTNYTADVETRLIGDYNLYNALAAVAIGKYFGVNGSLIGHSIHEYAPKNSRSQLQKIGDNNYILDAYNANPSSMRAAIKNFAEYKAQKKIMLLGAMMELGNESKAEHRSLVDFIDQYTWEKVVLVGGDFAELNSPYIYLPNAIEAKAWLSRQNLHNATILVKGSRSMAMENVLP